jgi:hypothetical protein
VLAFFKIVLIVKFRGGGIAGNSVGKIGRDVVLSGVESF